MVEEKTGEQTTKNRVAEVFQIIGSFVKIAVFFFSICAFMLGMAARLFSVFRKIFPNIFRAEELHNNDGQSGKKEKNHGAC